MIATLPREILLPRLTFPAWVRKLGDPLRMFGHGAMSQGVFAQPMGGAAAGSTFDPASIAWNLWLEADAVVGLNDGDTVTTIPDQSVNNNDAGVIGGTCTYETNVFGNKPAIRKGGPEYNATSVMGSTTGIGITGNSDRTFFFVIYAPDAQSVNEGMFFDPANQNLIGSTCWGMSCSKLYTWGSDYALTAPFTTPTPAGGAVWTMSYQGSSKKLNTWINTTPTTVDQVLSGTPNTANLGYRMFGWKNGDRSVGINFCIGAAFAIGSLLDAPQLANMQTHLMTKYSIS